MNRLNLLTDGWIPVRDRGGTGLFRFLTYEELLCGDGTWQVSLPRDDLELACIQLLVCMTQVMFLPEDVAALRQRSGRPLSSGAFADGTAPCRDWFDLDHPTQPFMQTRGVKAAKATPIQKVLIGLPEGNNHAFFNEVGEVRRVGGTVAAVALFHQASNCPSFGGGFKGSLRGGGPITTLVAGGDLRATIWRNVLTAACVREFLPDWEQDHAKDVPTWVSPISEGATMEALDIGLTRGLFWQPGHVELLADAGGTCDLIGEGEGRYGGFRTEKFNFSVSGLWPHPHGARVFTDKKEWKFVSFTTSAPAWTWLAELLVPRALSGPDAKEGCIPAPAIAQLGRVWPREAAGLHLLVGGYRTKKASVTERRHELFSLAAGWEEGGRLRNLVSVANDARRVLRNGLLRASEGKKKVSVGNKKKHIKGIGAPIQESGEKLFYACTDGLIRNVVADAHTWEEFLAAKQSFAKRLAVECSAIFAHLTNPYTHKPELILAIAWARRTLNSDLSKLEASQ